MKSKKILKNSAILFAARTGEGLMQLAILALVTRFLGVALFGEYAFVITVSFFYSVFISLGTGNILIREVAKNKSKTSEYASVVIVIRLLMSMVTLAVILPLTSLFSFSPFIVRGFCIMVLAHFTLAIGKTFEEIYIAHERMGFIFYISLISRAVEFTIILVAYIVQADHLIVYGGIVAANTMRVLIAFWIGKKYFIFRFQNIDLSTMGFFIKNSLSLFGAMVLRQFNVRVDVFFLQAFVASTELALYHAPHRIFMNMQAVPFSITGALFPRFTKTAEESRELLADHFEKIFKIFLIGGILVCMIAHLWAEEVIMLLFSPEYAGAIICFKILAWTFLTGSISSLLETLLIVVDRQKKIMIATFIGLCINIILDIVLIPRHGAMGASYATMISYLCGSSLMFFYLNSILNKKALYTITVKTIALAILSLTTVYYFMVNKFIGTALLIIMFLALLQLFKVINKKELSFFFHLLRKKTGPPPAEKISIARRHNSGKNL